MALSSEHAGTNGSWIPDWQVSSCPPLPGGPSRIVYEAKDPYAGVYNHHPAVAILGDRIVVIWSNHLQGHVHTASPPQNGEDGPGQKIMVSSSLDGKTWTPAETLLDSMGPYAHAEDAGRAPVANGFAWHDDHLYAIVEGCDVGPRNTVPRARTGLGRLARRVFVDGSLGETCFWLNGRPPDPIEGFPQDPEPESRPEFATAAAALTSYLTQPLHHPAWDFMEVQPEADGHGMCEPSTYQRPDGMYVRLYRDIGQRGFLYAAQSADSVFATPQRTSIPDSPSKTISLNLPDGRVCIIGNLSEKRARDPLSMAVSADGIHFTWARAICSGAPSVRFPGPGKGPGFQYPSATVKGNTIHLVYSIGKEDIAYSAVAVPAYEDTTCRP